MTCPYCNAPTIPGAKFCIRCGRRLAAPSAEKPGFLEKPGFWRPGQTLVDDFVVERELGAGGMGTVYLVRGAATGDRYAVKISQAQSADVRRLFLAELQTWIDLPAHPHVAGCRFVRVIGERIAIFAEYLAAGSVAGWIAQQKSRPLPSILDFAIQAAWGLHAVHEQGLVHQDVKPGNVLLNADGVVKVADFGLARARKQAGESLLSTCLSTRVSVGGMTPAYCSPEQAAGQRLTRATDVWSWGMTVLEMFTGEVTWTSGVAAADVLTQYRKENSSIPAPVADVLARCFRARAEDRWGTLEEAARQLIHVLAKESRQSYARSQPAFPRRRERQESVAPRKQARGGPWDDPLGWLRLAYKESGRDEAAADRRVAASAISRAGKTVADLAVFEEAQRILEQLVDSGRKDMVVWLAGLYEHIANLHQELGDLHRMEKLADQAIAIAERVVAREGEGPVGEKLASAYYRKANALHARDPAEARRVMGQAIDLMERVVNEHGRHDLENYLASAYNSQGMFCRALRDPQAALENYNRAIHIREALIEKSPTWEYLRDLAVCYLNKANVLSQTSGYTTGRNVSYLKKGKMHYSHDEEYDAVEYYDRCIKIREQLVHEVGRTELAPNLALAYRNRAAAAMALGSSAQAREFGEKAVTICRELVNQGRSDQAIELARALYNLAIFHADTRAWRQAVALSEEAIEIWGRLVHHDGQRQFLGEYADARAHLGEFLCELKDPRGRKEMQEAVALLEAEVARTRRPELERRLHLVREILQNTK